MPDEQPTLQHAAAPGANLSDAATGLVSTKLSQPRLNRDHVSRPRLLAQLEAITDRPLLLLRAPAGSGKSTLLVEWLGQLSMSSGWVSLDEADNDLAGFLSYMLAAIRRAFPQARLATRWDYHRSFSRGDGMFWSR